jgi:hypothetical protein
MKNELFEYTDVTDPSDTSVYPSPKTKDPNVFKPMYLHELVNNLYEDQTESTRKFMVSEILDDANNKGRFWERVLAKHMPHTKLLKHNTPFKDFDDGSDAKFAISGRYVSGVFQASIGIENKIGTLRVCMVSKGDQYHRLFFMRIPYSFYCQRNPESPLKISFVNFVPYGEIWDKFQCSWEEVIAPIETVDNKSEIVYTDEYQYIIENLP